MKFIQIISEIISFLKKLLTETTVEIVLLGVGIAATGLSIWYTYDYQTLVGDDPKVALIFSVILVIFLTILFSFGVELAIQKQKGKAVWIFIAWAILVTYSMQNTVASQYTDIMNERAKKAEVVGNDLAASDQAEVIEERLTNKRNALKLVESEISRLTKLLQPTSEASGQSTPAWLKSQYQKSLDAEKVKMDTLTTEIDKLLGAKSEGVRNTQISSRRNQGDIFDFYAKVLNLKAEQVELALAVFKGFILDTMNVVCFMVVILREKWKKDEELLAIKAEEERQKAPEEKIKGYATILSNICFGKGARRNGTFISEQVAFTQYDIPRRDYRTISAIALTEGLINRHGNKLYVNRDVTPEEFVEKVVENA